LSRSRAVRSRVIRDWTSFSVRSKKSETCRRETMSVCPGATGNASSATNPCSFVSRMRSAASEQNAQSFAGKSLIVFRNLLIAGLADRGQVVRCQLPPQRWTKADEGQITPVVEEVLPPAELLERHGEHDAAHFIFRQ